MSRIDPVELARELVRRPSVTPINAGALDIVERTASQLGFSCTRLPFGEDEERVENLYARWGASGRNLCFAGHTDVVPPGADDQWTTPPFEPVIADGYLYGRGSADMKGAIAAFLAAAERAIAAGAVKGSLCLLITGDEEGPAVNGTRRVLEWLAERNERIDHCVVGEPSGYEILGDLMKVGRRGSMNCWLTVYGKQGHVAYPDRAFNPIPALLKKLLTLSETPLDDGYERFQPSSLQVTDIHIGNTAANVIPSRATARFNIRFNPTWTGVSLEAWLRAKLDAISTETGARYELKAVASGDAFLTTDDIFLTLLSNAVEAHTGRRPQYSTTGGTSDARFIKDYAPVAELGLVGATIHQANERAAVADILTLVDIYADIIARYFRSDGS